MVHLASHVGECIHFIRICLIRQISFQKHHNRTATIWCFFFSPTEFMNNFYLGYTEKSFTLTLDSAALQIYSSP